MSESVFVLIELLKSDADVVDKGVTERVLCKACEEEEEKEEEEEEEDCEVCEEEEEERCNAAINEVKRPKIASRSLKECERVEVNDSVSENVM